MIRGIKKRLGPWYANVTFGLAHQVTFTECHGHLLNSFPRSQDYLILSRVSILAPLNDRKLVHGLNYLNNLAIIQFN